jgi:hypothetical protein
VLAGDGTGHPPRLNVARQHAHHIPEGQIRVADAGMGAAVPVGHHQLGINRLSPAGELGQQRRLSPPRLPGDEYDPAPTRQRSRQVLVQLPQLALAGHEDRTFGDGPPFDFFKESWGRLGVDRLQSFHHRLG